MKLDYQTLCGLITKSGTLVEFLIPIFKLSGVSRASFDGTGIIRQNGNYLFGSSTEQEKLNLSAIRIRENGVQSDYTFPSAPNKVVNNSAVCISINGTITFW